MFGAGRIDLANLHLRLLADLQGHHVAAGTHDANRFLGILETVLGQIGLGLGDEALGPDVGHSCQAARSICPDRLDP